MNIWNEWLQKQTSMPENKLPDRIKLMYSMYGKTEGKKCGNCAHFRKLEGYAGTYYKCDLTKLTHGSKTDWRVNWVACGKFEKREGNE